MYCILQRYNNFMERHVRNFFNRHLNILKTVKCPDQYSNYSVEVDGETLNLNGINTQGENIADNGGIKEALRCVYI
jgi:hypothetical protein